MGTLRITKTVTDKGKKTPNEEHVQRIIQAAGATNDDRDCSEDHPQRYNLDKAQADTPLIHTRHDVATGRFQNEAILNKLKGITKGGDATQVAILLVLVL